MTTVDGFFLPIYPRSPHFVIRVDEFGIKVLCVNQIPWYKSDFHILGLLRGSQGEQNRESVAFSPSCPISWPSGSCDWWKQVARRGGDPGHNHSVWRSGNH